MASSNVSTAVPGIRKQGSKVVMINGTPIIVNPPMVSVPLGKDRKGEEQILDLACCRHIFVASPNPARKDKMIEFIMQSAIKNAGSNGVKFLASSFTSSKLRSHDGKPYMVNPVIGSEYGAIRVLDYLYDENTRRQKLFRSKHADWLMGYNDMVGPSEKIPYLIYVVDEISGLMRKHRADLCRKVSQIALSSRFTGVFLLFGTSDICPEVIREDFMKAFHKRIVFRVDDASQSKLLIGSEGAEHLGRDRIFLFDPDYLTPDRIKLSDQILR